MIKQMRLSLL